MSDSLQILQDDLWKLWSEIEMAQISMAVGILFTLAILKMSLATIDRRDFVTQLMYAVYIILVFLTLLIVVPDTMRTQSPRETQLICTIVATFIAFIRWNTKFSVKKSESTTAKPVEAKNG